VEPWIGIILFEPFCAHVYAPIEVIERRAGNVSAVLVVGVIHRDGLLLAAGTNDEKQGLAIAYGGEGVDERTGRMGPSVPNQVEDECRFLLSEVSMACRGFERNSGSGHGSPKKHNYNNQS
jgi:hypothetical protein